MPRAFDITGVTDSIRLDSRGQGELAFTVSNALRAPVRARASVVPGPGMKPEWATIEGGEERDFTPDGTQQLTVRLKVPPGTPPGRHTFHLLMVDVSNPDERYAEGPTIAFEVMAAGAPPPKKFPWWVVALAAGVLLIIGGVVAILTSRGEDGGTGGGGPPGLGETCTGDGGCAEGLGCTSPDGGVCLGQVGFLTCDGGTQCLSGFCDTGRCEAVPPGRNCRRDLDCPSDQRCTLVVAMNQRLCLLKAGQACNVNRDCASYFCKSGQCTQENGACATNEDCLSPSLCTATKLCLMPVGRFCGTNAHCLTGLCVNSVCTAPDIGAPTCTTPCPDFNQCLFGRCFPVSTSTLNQEILRRMPVRVSPVQTAPPPPR